jgi:predicted hydrolase (HD superfamily)
MLVTGNGVVWSVEEENDLWIADFIAALDMPDTIDDDVAEHALDTICFLQDEDISTPIDDIVQTPWGVTLTDFDLAD